MENLKNFVKYAKRNMYFNSTQSFNSISFEIHWRQIICIKWPLQLYKSSKTLKKKSKCFELNLSITSNDIMETNKTLCGKKIIDIHKKGDIFHLTLYFYGTSPTMSSWGGGSSSPVKSLDKN